MATGFFSNLVPDLNSNNTCKQVVDGVTTVLGIGSNFTPGGPLVGVAVGAGLTAIGAGVKAAACDDDPPAKAAATPAGPVSLIPNPWKDMPPVARSHAPRVTGRSTIAPGTGGLY